MIYGLLEYLSHQRDHASGNANENKAMNLQENDYYKLMVTLQQVDLHTWSMVLNKTLDGNDWGRQEYYMTAEQLSAFADYIRESLGQ
jgi:Fic family protein